MNIDFKIILLLICSQIFLLLLHIAVLRITIKKKVNFSSLLVAVKCAIFGNIPLLLMTWLLTVKMHMNVYETINVILYVLLTYNALAYSYCHIFNMGDTARRIRILYELTLAGRLKYNDLEDKYGVKNMLEVRLERLIAMNQVSKHQGHYILKSLVFYWIGVMVLKWGFFLKYNTHLREFKK